MSTPYYTNLIKIANTEDKDKGIFITDNNGVILFCNKTLLTICGFNTEEEVVGYTSNILQGALTK